MVAVMGVFGDQKAEFIILERRAKNDVLRFSMRLTLREQAAMLQKKTANLACLPSAFAQQL